MKRSLITAHSGCDGTPENSMDFVHYALTLKVDCLEVDIRRGTDGMLFLAHDESGIGPSFRAALTALARHPLMKINCDLKEAGLEAAVLACAGECGVADRLIYSGTVSRCAATEKVEWFLNVELLFPEEFTFAKIDPAAALARIEAGMHASGARCLNAQYAIADTPLYSLLRAHGVPLSLWTPSEEALIRRFLSEGVYNITTRNARRACAIAGEGGFVGGAL